VEEEGQSHGIIEGRGDGGVLHFFYHTTFGIDTAVASIWNLSFRVVASTTHNSHTSPAFLAETCTYIDLSLASSASGDSTYVYRICIKDLDINILLSKEYKI